MPAPIRCCYCREVIHPSNGKWIGVVSNKATCKQAPDKRHARQRVVQPCK